MQGVSHRPTIILLNTILYIIYRGFSVVTMIAWAGVVSGVYNL